MDRREPDLRLEDPETGRVLAIAERRVVGAQTGESKRLQRRVVKRLGFRDVANADRHVIEHGYLLLMRRVEPAGPAALLGHELTRARRFAAWGKLLVSAHARRTPIPARAQPAPLTARSPREGWRAATAGACMRSSCRAGPSDRPFEERHDGFSVSAVLDGTFTYRSGAGHGLLYPGSLLLGNHGQCFECGHAHGLGDRCVSLNVREDLFGEIAAAAGSSRFRFAAPSLPTPEALPIVASLEALSAFGSAPGREEMALTLARAGHCSHGRRSTRTWPPDRARGEAGGRSDPAHRVRGGAAAGA